MNLKVPRRFIHGFRRDNIAIEVVKAPPASRFALVRDVLDDEARRPAIVYAPKRKDAETLAELLNHAFPAAAYHAGLEGARRQDVQSRFQAGKLQVIVATTAFGMGIDKADVRTVLHTALPGSLEGYYQEIGRAGRDGAPSRAILMHSYADRYTHDFFHERDYPDPSVVERIFNCLTANPQPKEAVLIRSRLAEEAFDIAMEKLWIHGGAVVDYAENLSRGIADWRESYVAQREHKMAQFERMLAYGDVAACRMTTLVRYFGDVADSHGRCGMCDFCDPEGTVAQSSRPASDKERAQAVRILDALKHTDAMATGRLYTQVFGDGSVERRALEELLGALARCGLIQIANETFEKDGKRIEYRKARITPAGQQADASTPILIPVEIEVEARVKKGKVSKKKAAAAPKKTRSKAAVEDPVEKALRAWRMAEAKRKAVPAFRILTDRTLQAIAERRPQTTRELIELPGVGLAIAEKYGAQIFRIVMQAK